MAMSKGSMLGQTHSLADCLEEVKRSYNITYELKPEQFNVIKAVIDGNHVFSVLPTGFGKSDCFILPPLILDQMDSKNYPHKAIVLSPLRSLMLSQVASLREKGIRCCAVLQMHEMTPDDIKGLECGIFSIIFMSPEALQIEKWRSIILKFRKEIHLVACDEAHCISQWGSDFRPQYKDVSVLRSLTTCPFLLLTATCTATMMKDILDAVLLVEENVKTIATVPDRPNIYLHFQSKPNMKFQEEIEWLVDEIAKFGVDSPKTIIYCRTIREVGDMYEHIMSQLAENAWLQHESRINSRMIEMYHSSVTKGTEDRVLSEFPKPDSTIRCLVSTIAFGMGIQISDIRQVIHWGVSKNVLSYWKEIGRCALDGCQGKAFLYAHGRCMDKRRTDAEMIEVCKDTKERTECLRVNILEKLIVPAMKIDHLDYLKNRKPCTLSCSVCVCPKCNCCSVCKNSCPCVQKCKLTGEFTGMRYGMLVPKISHNITKSLTYKRFKTS